MKYPALPANTIPVENAAPERTRGTLVLRELPAVSPTWFVVPEYLSSISVTLALQVPNEGIRRVVSPLLITSSAGRYSANWNL